MEDDHVVVDAKHFTHAAVALARPWGWRAWRTARDFQSTGSNG